MTECSNPYKVGLICMVLRVRKDIVCCGSRVCLESSLLRLKCVHSSARQKRFSYGTLKVMQTLNHIYQPKYTQGHQVSGILYLYDKSNTSRRTRLRIRFGLFRFFDRRFRSVSELAWYRQYIDSKPPMIPAYAWSGEPWGVHSMCQVLWTYEHSLVLPGS